MRLRVGSAGGALVAALVACGEGTGPGVDSTPGDVQIPIAYVECSGDEAQIATLSDLCGQFFYPMTWERDTSGGIVVDVGGEISFVEITAQLPSRYDPEEDYRAPVEYDAVLHRAGDATALSGSLVTETLVPSCNGGRFRAGGTLEWQDVDLDISWEAYPATGCDGGTGGAGGAGGAIFGSGGAGGGGAGGGGGG
jgi:hypothetical protein